MSILGKNLRKYRTELKLSLLQVASLTGITNSRLSKIERDEITCHPTDLILLARTYKKPLISLYIDAGFLTPSDLPEYQSEFQGISLLDDDEKQHIQEEINFINRKKVENNGI